MTSDATPRQQTVLPAGPIVAAMDQLENQGAKIALQRVFSRARSHKSHSSDPAFCIETLTLAVAAEMGVELDQ